MKIKIIFVGSIIEFSKEFTGSSGIEYVPRLLLGTTSTNGMLRLSMFNSDMLADMTAECNKASGKEISYHEYETAVIDCFQGLEREGLVGEKLDMTTYPDKMYAFMEVT